jgi:hypothetical protein
MKPTIRIALCWTVPWVVALCSLLVLANLQLFVIDSHIHTIARWSGATLMVALAFAGLVRASRYVSKEEGAGLAANWYQDGNLVALVIFWSMFPPAWFFVEYYCLDAGFFLPKLAADGQPLDRVVTLAAARTYADLAAKIWAGSSAVIGALLAVTRRQ